MAKAAGIIIFIFGLFILIGSIGMFVVASATVNDYETTAGQLSRALSEDAQNEYEGAVALQACSGIIAVIGIVFSIVGGVLLFKSDQPQQPQQPYYQTPTPQYQPPSPQYQQPPVQSYQYPQQQYQQPMQVPQQQTPQSQMRYCSSCGKQIPMDSKLCPYCGLQQINY